MRARIRLGAGASGGQGALSQPIRPGQERTVGGCVKARIGGEQRARADLEALVDTSPIGVVVFDAATGWAVRFNHEARRIVEGLGTPGQAPEQLAQTIACRRPDGREVRLGALCDAETLRAEEVELSVPDGRSVATLINATPIRLADGAVETVVVIVKPFSPTELVARIRAALRREAGPECCRDAPLPVADGTSLAVQTPNRPHPRWALDTAGRFVQHRPRPNTGDTP